MLTIGFSGTQVGATSAQLAAVRFYLVQYKPDFGCHGACIGADKQFDDLLRMLRIRRIVYSALMPPGCNKCALAEGDADVWHPAKPPLERNHDIVNASQIMLFTPQTAHERLRSGTWATYRYATKQDVARLLILPSGEIVASEDPDTLPRKDRHSEAFKAQQTFGPVREVTEKDTFCTPDIPPHAPKHQSYLQQPPNQEN